MNYSVCVVTLEGDEISVVQVEVSELLLELGKGVERAGKVVSTLDVGRRAVSAAKKHPPAWSSSLRPVRPCTILFRQFSSGEKIAREVVHQCNRIYRGLDGTLAYEFNGDLGREGKDISA